MKALVYLGSTAAATAKSERPESPSVAVAGDLRVLDRAAFRWTLDRRGWRRSHDAEGRRQDCGGIPDSIAGLKDDPFRSLASALRRAGGYAKHDAPFSDFLWADLLRHRIPAKLIDDDFDAALREALASEAGLDGTAGDIAGDVRWQKLRTTAASSPPSLQD